MKSTLGDRMTRREIAVGSLLIALGCATMVGDVFGLGALRAFGLATAASPAPKVFTAQDGFETYANRFYLIWYDAAGTEQRTELTPAVYAALKGPYNRRNVYGAVVSYAPVLDANPVVRPMFRSALVRSFCRANPVTVELGLPGDAARNGPVSIRLEPRGKQNQQGFQLIHEIRCDVR